jgi:hypothetical protein
MKQKSKFILFNNLGAFCLTLGPLLIIIFLLAKEIAFWDVHLVPIKMHWSLGVFIGLLLSLFGLFSFWIIRSKPHIDLFSACTALTILIFSDWINSDYALIHGPIIRGELFLFSIFAFIIIKNNLWHWVSFLPIVSSVLSIWAFLSLASGRIIFADDHAVFFYRLTLLKENFPNIPFYNPLWNAGYDARDFFATGSLNVFSLFSIFIYLFDVKTIYNLIVVSVMFILTPYLTYLASKRSGLQKPVPAMAATLSITFSLLWFRWALQYGTMGFITSLAFVPLNIIFLIDLLLKKQQYNIKSYFLICSSFTLMLFWAPSGIVFIPLIAYSLFNLPKVFKNKPLLICTLAILTLNTPWMLAFWSVSNVSNFITNAHNSSHINTNRDEVEDNSSQSSSIESSKINVSGVIAKAVKYIRNNTVSLHPLILIFGLIGIFYLPKHMRWFFLVTVIWLFLLGSLVSPIKPRLELERFLLILGLLLCIPTAQGVFEATKHFNFETTLKKIILCVPFGLLLTGIFSSISAILGRTPIHYSFLNNAAQEMIEQIAKLPNNGRVAFTGFVLHELNGGHLAPLAYFTNKPLIASSPVHNLWTYKQLVPAEYLREDDAGIEKYFDLINTSAVFAHEPFWKEYFTKNPDKYKKVWQGGKFLLFERTNNLSSYFAEGSGEIISQTNNSVILKLNTNAAVIKFNYFPFLKSSACKLTSRSYPGEINFIELTDCPVDSNIEIKSASLVQRLFGGNA